VPSEREALGDPSRRLGYLLKHAQLRFGELVGAALAPLGIDGRQWGALLCLDDQPRSSQAELARWLGIDRTTMVALIDDLETKGLVERRPHADDRRKNTVELTVAGCDIKRRAARLVDDCERRFLATLSERQAQQLRRALELVITPEQLPDAP
jgi:DNA-binding MarR family transcriptional regulator